jgi:hypothetical protein
VHPLGKSPVITCGSLTAESGAIIEYLVERRGNGRLAPLRGSDERLRYIYWLHFVEGSAMPPLLFTRVCDKVKSAPMPFFIKPIARGIAAKVMDGFVTPKQKSQLDFMGSRTEALGVPGAAGVGRIKQEVDVNPETHGTASSMASSNACLSARSTRAFIGRAVQRKTGARAGALSAKARDWARRSDTSRPRDLPCCA